ncbi:MAG: hypothetical protein EBQ97_05310, partial [Bacteroidetes bacterium]|nr:hypothetical protein [Bacteroidota bacterium]
MKFRGSLLLSTVFLGILAWINRSQADPIEKALKLIRVYSVNPVLYHALALLPDNKESDAQLHLALTALQY